MSGRAESGQELALTSREHRRLADVLLNAAHERRAIPSLTEAFRELTIADACRVRDMLLARRIAAGDRLIGAKASLGREPGHVEEPQLGWLTLGMLVSNGVIDASRLIRPRIEARLAFVLARPLREQIAAGSELLAATERVAPCLEIVDSRYGAAHVRRADDIADNCSTGRLVLGELVAPPAEGHLRRLRVQVHSDAVAWLAAGARARAPVDPLEATTWLANRLLRGGNRLEPGTLLVCPVGGGSVDLVPGVRVGAVLRGIGRVELRAVGELPLGPRPRAAAAPAASRGSG